MTIAFIPGSFDPPTKAHISLIIRAAKIFEKVIVGVGSHHAKNAQFTLQNRISMVQNDISDLADALIANKTNVVAYSELTVVAAKKYHATVIVRGARDTTDFEYETKIAANNRLLDPAIDTLLIPSIPSEKGISSSIAKQIAQMGGDLSHFVSAKTAANLIDYYKHKQR